MTDTATDIDRSKMQVSDEVAIQINNMNKWYGTFHVLRDINLTVNRGERIVIAGPSGSGKSTMIRCINRLEEHQQGDIIVDGTELTSDLKNIDKIRSEVGMCFQHFNLFPHLTILENCTLAPIWVRKTPKKEAEETAMHFLEKVKIPDQAHKYPGQLSGGQQQRVAIARSLCMKPRIMLFDEPTSALDPEMIKEVLDSTDLPVFGICLGHQMLALALGGQTIKMNHGHHGANHPVKDLDTGKVEITSMNHGFAVDAESLPEGVVETHRSLFDGSNCGIRMTDRPVYSVQYHPEASPGPQDSFYLFERFAAAMADRKAQA